MEEWRDALDYYQGVYQISNLGRVKRIKNSTGWSAGHILKPKTDSCGYHHVRLQHKKKQRPVSVHTLVAEAFLGKPEEGMEVNHKNGIKTDNRPENLEWVSHAENMAHYLQVLRGNGPVL